MTTPNGAIIDGEYRYVLWRDLAWDLGPAASAGAVLWVMLNPSVATDITDDPTIRKVMGFSRRWGFSQARVANLYALRSTNPKALLTHPDPVGPKNDEYITDELAKADAVVLAWGRNAKLDRAAAVLHFVKLHCMHVPTWHLGLTQNRHPKHPLMLGYDTRRVEAD